MQGKVEVDLSGNNGRKRNVFSGLQNIETITVNNPEKDRVNYLRIRNENKINSHSFQRRVKTRIAQVSQKDYFLRLKTQSSFHSSTKKGCETSLEQSSQQSVNKIEDYVPLKKPRKQFHTKHYKPLNSISVQMKDLIDKQSNKCSKIICKTVDLEFLDLKKSTQLYFEDRIHSTAFKHQNKNNQQDPINISLTMHNQRNNASPHSFIMTNYQQGAKWYRRQSEIIIRKKNGIMQHTTLNRFRMTMSDSIRPRKHTIANELGNLSNVLLKEKQMMFCM